MSGVAKEDLGLFSLRQGFDLALCSNENLHSSGVTEKSNGLPSRFSFLVCFSARPIGA